MSEIMKKSVGRPSVNATPITLRLPPEMLAAIDKFVDEEVDLNRPKVIRLILKDWLTGAHMLPSKE